MLVCLSSSEARFFVQWIEEEEEEEDERVKMGRWQGLKKETEEAEDHRGGGGAQLGFFHMT